MKKLNFFKILFLSFLSFVFFNGCKSLPQTSVVEPLDLLDKDSFFYVSIPNQVDPNLINIILLNNVQSLSQKDAELISERIQHVYCGLIKNRQGTEIQASIQADVPTSYIPKVFSKKNGWNSELIKISNTEREYISYSNNEIDIAFPSSNIVCLGRGLPYMINTYDLLAHEVVEPEQTVFNENVNKSELPDDLYEYLLNATDEIRFYANKPQSFLSVLTGANLDLKLVQVYGNFVVDQKHTSQYVLELNFDFKNEKFLRAGKGLLALAFGLANGQTEVVGNTKLVVKDIRIKKEQLYKILTVGA